MKETKKSPTWDEISIRQYIDIMRILSDETRKEEMKALDIIPVIWPQIDPETIPMGEAINYINLTNELLSAPLEATKSDLPKSFAFQGFGDCRITEIDKMTLSQFMDFQNISVLSSNEHLAELLSVCIVPIGKKYNQGYDIMELQTQIEELPITTAPAILDFFVARSKKSLRRMKISLATMIATNREMTIRSRLKALTSLTSMMDLLVSL